MKVIKVLVFLCIVTTFIPLQILSQKIDDKYLQNNWNANWIRVPKTSSNEYGVYFFRLSFQVNSIPKTFPVFVSADNRYKLFINEKQVSIGPARGDILHWNFETVDLASYLKAGNNVVAAIVWNESSERPDANVSLQTGFILQGGSVESEKINTCSDWKCTQDSSNTQIIVNLPGNAYRAGSGELVDMKKRIEGWMSQSFNDKKWADADVITSGFPKNKTGYGGPNGWLLVPSTLPQMELKVERLKNCVKSVGINVPATFSEGKTAITIPPHTNATLLLDQTYLTNAYSSITFSGGKNGTITLGYAEALYKHFRRKLKTNRNEIDDKIFKGRTDSIISNGLENQQFTSLNWRTYRYLQISVRTMESSLTINDVYGVFTGYPFKLNAKLYTNNEELNKMFDIGWRTARLCAVETYMDCPYYEQLQYIGDTRIQAMVSLFNSGDDRLVRNALNQFDYSRQPEGVTMSRYPTVIPQYIPTFSLLYIGMLHDYMMYGNDLNFIKEKLLGVKAILHYFEGFQQADGSIRKLPWWNFTDWVNVKKWDIGTREFGADGNSALLDFQLLWAYELAAHMEKTTGMKNVEKLYQHKVEILKKTIRNKYWDNKKLLFADRAEKDLFSQHTNALAILTDVVPNNEMPIVAKKLLTDSTLAPASIYFKYYLHQALTKAGLGNDYLNWLDIWRENMALGLTTWAETSDVSNARSDCHAWGASPNIEIFRTILGIDSDAPGFSVVRIEPHLGSIKNIGGEIPHPYGKISVKYNIENGFMSAEIKLPLRVKGVFIWNGKKHLLKEGLNNLEIHN